MYRHSKYCALILSLCALSSYGQIRHHAAPHAKTTVASLQELDYDVQYVKLDITATNASTAISGHVTTRAKVTASSMNDYVFEMSQQLTIDSAKINGQILPVSATGVINTISLPGSLLQNDWLEADIWYHGQPTGGTGFFTNGILHQTNGSPNVDVTHTVSAAFHSRDWWPCKQGLTDKMDSADIWVTVPNGLKVAGNGLLQQVVPVSGGNRYEWKLRYPADYYLLSFAIAPYAEYNYYMHFSNSMDSMLVQNFIYDDPSVLLDHKDELDTIGLIIDYFSDIFGRYPFDKEKFGICQTPLPGGMENQTMVSLGSLDATLIAHELSHQWWGDNVTCASTTDMWLNEGWATYSEQLFVEHFRGTAAAFNYRSAVFANVLTTINGSVYVADSTNETRIYDGRMTYNKGAALAHMLRFMINDDNRFFQVLKDYQQQYQYGNALTDDLKNIAEQVSGVDLDTFFQQWFHGEGFPVYGARWAQDGSGQVVIKLTQAGSKPAVVSLFKMPLEIRLTSSQGDTTIRIYNDHATQYYSFNWGKSMTGLAIDPDNHILNKTGTIAQDPAVLSVNNITHDQLKVFPNPADTEWLVTGVPDHAMLELYNSAGQKIWQNIASDMNMHIPAASLPSGNYVLSVTTGDKQVISYHLLR